MNHDLVIEDLALEAVDLRATLTAVTEELADETVARMRYERLALQYLYEWTCERARFEKAHQQIRELMGVRDER